MRYSEMAFPKIKMRLLPLKDYYVHSSNHKQDHPPMVKQDDDTEPQKLYSTVFSNDTPASPQPSGIKRENYKASTSKPECAVGSRRFRQSLKQNPEKLQEYRQQDALRSKFYRANMTSEQRVHYNITSKLRMRKMRQNKTPNKAPTACALETKAPEQDKERRREKERLRKRASRARKTQEERDEINRKRREKRLQKNVALKEFTRLKEEVTRKREDLQEQMKKLEEAEKLLEAAQKLMD